MECSKHILPPKSQSFPLALETAIVNQALDMS